MNKYFSTFFLIILFFTSGQTFPLFSSSPEDLKYFKLLPEGKIREYCEKNYSYYEYKIEVLNRMIWSAIKEKECDSMTEAEKLAFKDVGWVWSENSRDRLFVNISGIAPHRGLIKNLTLSDWKEDNFKCVREAVVTIAQEMNLPPDQQHQELVKIINRFIEFREDVEKAKEISGKSKQSIKKDKEKTPNKRVCLSEGLIDSSDRPNIPSTIILGEN